MNRGKRKKILDQNNTWQLTCTATAGVLLMSRCHLRLVKARKKKL
jgi:uncharacterized membrane protein (UPF0136 family)